MTVSRCTFRRFLSGFVVTALAGTAILGILPVPPSQAACGARVQTGFNQGALALAQRCGTTVNELKRANPMLDLDKPINNTQVKIPQDKTYIPEAIDRGEPAAGQRPNPVVRSHNPVDPDAVGNPRRTRAHDVRRISVRRGDTLSAIARSAGVSLDGLMAANPGVDPRRLRVGQPIAVPRLD